jgi:hypothetical protein
MGFIASIILGILAGWITGLIMKSSRSGYGIIGDLVLGVIRIGCRRLADVALPGGRLDNRVQPDFADRIGARRDCGDRNLSAHHAAIACRLRPAAVRGHAAGSGLESEQLSRPLRLYGTGVLWCAWLNSRRKMRRCGMIER